MTTQRQQRAGGSFAPPLTDELIAKYEAMAEAADGPIRDAMMTCLACVKQWWDLPESSVNGSHEHPSGQGVIIPLDDPIAKELWDAIPWQHEIDAMAKLFDTIDPAADRELRNAAHHLLWHVVELNLDREPITADKL